MAPDPVLTSLGTPTSSDVKIEVQATALPEATVQQVLEASEGEKPQTVRRHGNKGRKIAPSIIEKRQRTRRNNASQRDENIREMVEELARSRKDYVKREDFETVVKLLERIEKKERSSKRRKKSAPTNRKKATPVQQYGTTSVRPLSPQAVHNVATAADYLSTWGF